MKTIPKAKRICKNCENIFYIDRWKLKWKKAIFCSRKCANIANLPKRLPFIIGQTPWNKGLHIYLGGKRFEKGQTPWNKGKKYELKNKKGWINSFGYKLLNKKREHRKIIEEYLGRKLTKDEIVHHINGIPTDNRIENLQVVTRGEHQRLHHLGSHYDKNSHTKALLFRNCGVD